MGPNASRRTCVEVGVANERALTSENVLAQSARGGRAGPVELDDTDHAGRYDMGKPRKGPEECHPCGGSSPHVPGSRNARPGAYGGGRWRNQPKAALDRTGENLITEASNVGSAEGYTDSIPGHH
jgi:hypothetical protein